MSPWLLLLVPAPWLALRVWRRLRLSRAKHRSLAGHAKMSKRVAKLLRGYSFGAERFFAADGAEPGIAGRRRKAFVELARHFGEKAARAPSAVALRDHVPDVSLVNAYRVPFPFASMVEKHLPVLGVVDATDGVQVRTPDGAWSYDLAGSYGVNVLGYDVYARCIREGTELVEAAGPVLGAYHPVVADNVRRLRAISGHDQVSFHMSGTEAVMQAVRLAQYHTGRRYIVRFCGAYHGWWDGVQPGPGNPRVVRDSLTLEEMSERTLAVLNTRTDIACVLVNPLQALHPNANAPADGSLVASGRRAGFDREAYAAWLARLREVCTARGIALILDDVFLGFRLAMGGSQEFFSVRADLVTYGKTVGGGLPIGVVCGEERWMRRFDRDRPSDLCFARGTFHSHPYVMGAMNAFLRRLDTEEVRASYAEVCEVWDRRARILNGRLECAALPVRFENIVSVWTTLYTRPSRYNWMFQYYLRREGLHLSWVGSGRFIFCHAYSDDEFGRVADRVVRAAARMEEDGWWAGSPELTARAIRKQLVGEIVAARMGRLGHAAPDELALEELAVYPAAIGELGEPVRIPAAERPLPTAIAAERAGS